MKNASFDFQCETPYSRAGKLQEGIMLNKDRLLGFEKFKRSKNNFHMHFVGKIDGESFIADIYRSQAPYKQCLEERPEFVELAKSLRHREDHFSPDYLKKLYAAYKLMRPYTKEDWDMFK